MHSGEKLNKGDPQVRINTPEKAQKPPIVFPLLNKLLLDILQIKETVEVNVLWMNVKDERKSYLVKFLGSYHSQL